MHDPKSVEGFKAMQYYCPNTVLSWDPDFQCLTDLGVFASEGLVGQLSAGIEKLA